MFDEVKIQLSGCMVHLRCIWAENGAVVHTFDSEHILLKLTIGHFL